MKILLIPGPPEEQLLLITTGTMCFLRSSLTWYDAETRIRVSTSEAQALTRQCRAFEGGEVMMARFDAADKRRHHTRRIYDSPFEDTSAGDDVELIFEEV